MESKDQGPDENYEREAAALKKMLEGKNGKEKLMVMLRALSAMKLTKGDPIPSLVLSVDAEGKLTMS